MVGHVAPGSCRVGLLPDSNRGYVRIDVERRCWKPTPTRRLAPGDPNRKRRPLMGIMANTPTPLPPLRRGALPHGTRRLGPAAFRTTHTRKKPPRTLPIAASVTKSGAQALNLRDSGPNVRPGLRPGGQLAPGGDGWLAATAASEAAPRGGCGRPAGSRPCSTETLAEQVASFFNRERSCCSPMIQHFHERTFPRRQTGLVAQKRQDLVRQFEEGRGVLRVCTWSKTPRGPLESEPLRTRRGLERVEQLSWIPLERKPRPISSVSRPFSAVAWTELVTAGWEVLVRRATPGGTTPGMPP